MAVVFLLGGGVHEVLSYLTAVTEFQPCGL